MQNFTGFRIVDPAEAALENCVEVLHKVKECNAKEMHEENGDNEQCPKKNMLFDSWFGFGWHDSIRVLGYLDN